MEITAAAAEHLKRRAVEESCVDPVFGFYTVADAVPTPTALLAALASGDDARLKSLAFQAWKQDNARKREIHLEVNVHSKQGFDIGQMALCGDFLFAFPPDWTEASKNWTLDLRGSTLILLDEDGIEVLEKWFSG